MPYLSCLFHIPNALKDTHLPLQRSRWQARMALSQVLLSSSPPHLLQKRKFYASCRPFDFCSTVCQLLLMNSLSTSCKWYVPFVDSLLMLGGWWQVNVIQLDPSRKHKWFQERQGGSFSFGSFGQFWGHKHLYSIHIRRLACHYRTGPAGLYHQWHYLALQPRIQSPLPLNQVLPR